MSFSLYTHLLEDDLLHYSRESRRLLAEDGKVMMTVFCLDHLCRLPAYGERWTFSHAISRSAVEDLRYPEAAVAYSEADLIDMCREAGFARAEVVPAGGAQSYVVASGSLEARTSFSGNESGRMRDVRE
jgi:hypothetical protein